MTPRATKQILGALGVFATITVCTLYVTKSTAQSAKDAESNAAPIYGVTIPAGYRDFVEVLGKSFGAQILLVACLRLILK